MPHAFAAPRGQSNDWYFFNRIRNGQTIVTSSTLLFPLWTHLPLSWTHFRSLYFFSFLLQAGTSLFFIFSSSLKCLSDHPIASDPHLHHLLDFSLENFFTNRLYILLIYIAYIFFVSLSPECKHCDDREFCLFSTRFESLLYSSAVLHATLPACPEVSVS